MCVALAVLEVRGYVLHWRKGGVCCTGCTGGKGACVALAVLKVREYVLHWLYWR